MKNYKLKAGYIKPGKDSFRLKWHNFWSWVKAFFGIKMKTDVDFLYGEGAIAGYGVFTEGAIAGYGVFTEWAHVKTRYRSNTVSLLYYNHIDGNQVLTIAKVDNIIEFMRSHKNELKEIQVLNCLDIIIPYNTVRYLREKGIKISRAHCD